MKASIDSTARIHDGVDISDPVYVGPYSILGKRSRVAVTTNSADENKYGTVIEKRCYCGPYVVIEDGAVIKEGVTIEGHGTVEASAHVGASSYVIYGAQVGGEAAIGSNCVIGGFIAERCTVGDGSRVFGSLLHRHTSPHISWDENIEPAPRLGKNVIVGFNSSVIGDVEIGDRVFIAANSVVTKDVPSRTVVVGENDFHDMEEWNGELSESPYFE